MEILKVENVGYTYQSKYQKIEAVKDVSCSFEQGKVYAIIGRSGSGKSTLLSLLAGLDLPTKGKIYVEDKEMSSINRDKYRRDVAPVIYQSFNLFPLLNAVENVMYPMQLQGKSSKEAKKLAKQYINEVELGEKAYKQFPTMMSGGEQQRVAVARALASGGKVLLADEPTGNLDTANSQTVVEILKKLAHEKNYAVIVITHDKSVAEQADIVYTMSDGYLFLPDKDETPTEESVTA